MSDRNLSKLQVRAEVLMVLQRLSSLDDSSRDIKLKQLKRLTTISNKNYVLECLLRELPRVSYDQRQIIAQLLIEFGTLEALEEPLWNIIKNPKYSDEVKDTANSVLRNLGDFSDPDLYLNYLENPSELIDKETERMLEAASYDPEIQIDFMDFLFSLEPVEQINLINSLKDMYNGCYLYSVLVPAIEMKPSNDLYLALLDSLGNTRSPKALQYLAHLYNFTHNDLIKRHIKKNINTLKLSGSNVEENIDETPIKVIENTTIYKCYASSIDGIGNQGVIISRLKGSDVSLFSVVVNDLQGVIDCFGFSVLTKQDFNRIVNKFQDGITRIDVSPEYCKLLLTKAEYLNRVLDISIPYEYTIWKVLSSDIKPMDSNIHQLIYDYVDQKLYPKIAHLYELKEFACWFIEEEDYDELGDFFENILTSFISGLSSDDVQVDQIIQNIDSSIIDLIETLFNDNVRNLYINRLENTAYLFMLNNMFKETALAATAAYSLKNDSGLPLKENVFLLTLLRKSVAESLLRFQYRVITPTDKSLDIVPQDKIQIYKEILDNMYVKWQVGF